MTKFRVIEDGLEYLIPLEVQTKPGRHMPERFLECTARARPGHSSYQIMAYLYAHIGEKLQKDAAAKADEVLTRRKKAQTQDAPKF